MANDPEVVTNRTALAVSVLDGTAVDWAALDAGATSDDDRAFLRHLRVIAAISPFAIPDSLHDSILHPGGVAPADQTAPIHWGALRVIEKVGRGSFGDVYRAWDTRLDREVALKLLRHREDNTSGSAVIEEGRLLARIRHPNVATVYGAERIDERTGVWMEFIHGETLEQEVARRGPLSPAEVVRIGTDLCSAVQAVHDAGLLHRDIKAQNVMRDQDGRIVLMDFGAGEDGQRPGTRVLTGTPAYLPPEVRAGALPDRRSDIYALGVLLWRVATGTFPTADGAAAGWAERQGAAADLPRALVDAIERALATDPDGRHESAGAFAAALKQPHNATAIVAAPGTAGSHRRHNTSAQTMVWRSAIALAAVVIVVATAWILAAGGNRRPSQPQSSELAAVPTRLAPSSASDPPVEPPPPAIPPPMTPSASAPEAPPGPLTDVSTANRLRRIRLPQRPMGRPSRDARYFPYVDTSGDLHVWEVPTARPRRVVEKTQAETLDAPVMAPRGDRVAYAASPAPGGWELRVVRADGTWPNVLIPHQTAYKPIPLDWSRDEQNILCRLNQRDGTADLVVVPASGGPPRLVQTFENGLSLSHASLSPDGRFIAYRVRVDARGTRQDIFTRGLDGSPPRLLFAGPVENPYPYARPPVWTPDGTHVVFLRESTKVPQSQDAWRIAVVDGAPQGDPVQVLSDIGGATGMGMTDDGALFYMITSSFAEVYTASIDLEGDVIRGAPTRISAGNIGRHRGPTWSPDGASIAYLTDRPSPVPGFVPLMTLTVKNLVSGAERSLTPALAWLSAHGAQWSADASSVIVYGKDRETQRNGLFRVDVRTSETTRVAWSDQNPPYFRSAPNGRDFLYVDSRGIVAKDLSTDDERVVVPRGGRSSVGPFGISPDGGSIAFVGRTAAEGGEMVTLEVQSAGGAARELLQVRPPNNLWFQLWTPDGRDILFSQWRSTGGPSRQVWRIPAAGGEPRDTGFAFSNAMNIGSLSPDGRRVAYNELEQFWELWIHESALDPLRLSKATKRR